MTVRNARRAVNPGERIVADPFEFGATRFRYLVGGVSRSEIEAAFPDWQMLSIEPAQTEGLGWPLTKTDPQWYRLRAPA